MVLVQGRQESPVAEGPMRPDAPGAIPWSGDVRSLTIRAWLEPGVPHLRVRVVEIPPDRGERPVIVTVSIDETCRAVRNWLESLQARGTNDDGDGVVTRKG
jgi:hypothetical protein